MSLRDPNQTYTYKIFGRNITLPKGFELAPGVSINQNKKSVEEGFKKLEKWLKNPTPENWNKIFGKNNAFGFQLRNYLLGRNDLGSVKGMPSANAIFDALNVNQNGVVNFGGFSTEPSVVEGGLYYNTDENEFYLGTG